MARQAGPYYITGCYDNICFYRMEGRYYARTKSSLTGKRVKKDHAFKVTMQYAALLKRASTIASQLYHELPKESKGISVYRKLTGKVMVLLKEGRTGDEVLTILGRHRKATKEQYKNHRRDNYTAKVYTYADDIIAKVFATRLPEIIHSQEMFTESLPP